MSTGKLKARWKRGGIRYTPEQRASLSKYHEASGWFRGARVTRR